MAKVIMVQGTMSSVGKSLIVAGLCRVFKQDGYTVCPFKSQNMALNSYITKDGLEMGRAQVMQAEAAGIEPDVAMNPILLKPTSDVGSQVIVNGEVVGNMKAREYFEYKKSLVPEIMKAYNKLDSLYDIIVIEGAGSPAEINLKDNDIVNMGMAELVDAPVILVGDIDRGGVFAQLLGTLMLLDKDERTRVKGLVINKFRGDKSILDPGIDMLLEKGKVDVVGVVPYMKLNLEDEDSVTERFDKVNRLEKCDDFCKNDGISDENSMNFSSLDKIDIAVIKLPHISNFTDFNVFEQTTYVNLYYVDNINTLGSPDMIILPGSKNTIADMKWLRDSRLEDKIKELAEDKKNEVPVFGICGGYQMLGKMIKDAGNQEEGGFIKGMELLPVETYISNEKTRRQISGRIGKMDGILSELSGKEYEGYEIHMGVSGYEDNKPVISPVVQNKNIYGTYIHGIFDKKEIAYSIIKALAAKKKLDIDGINIKNYKDIKDEEFDKLADNIRKFMDMDKIYKIIVD